MAENKTLKDFAQALGEAARQKAKSQNGDQGEAEDNELAQLTKPNSQEIGVPGMSSNTIHWVWGGLPRCTVEAYYRPATDERTPEYSVHLELDDDGPLEFSANQARDVGAALLSAYQWESVWQQHAGEFLA
jgi:hypothetical protein